MKVFILAFVCTLAIGGISGCQSKPVMGDAPVSTGQEVAPPAGCIDLRRRGGAC